jgi:hypothetical protein
MIQRLEVQQGGSTRHNNEPSVGMLLKELTDETRTLLRQEVELGKAEISEKVSTVGRNVAYLAVGGMVAYAGLLALIAAACIGAAILLGNVMDPEIASWLGPLIVGVIVAIIGYVFVQKALSTFKNETLMPRKTMESLRENTEWFKDQIKTTENRMTQPDPTIR